MANTATNMNNIHPIHTFEWNRPILRKDEARYQLTNLSEKAFRRLIQRLDLRSPLDAALNECGLIDKHRDLVQREGLEEAFQNAADKQGISGFDHSEPHRMRFQTLEGTHLVIDMRSGRIWIQGKGADEEQLRHSLDSLVGSAL